MPSASDSGRLRLGFFTSPAVKVTLFQASAENSEPTCATASIVSVPTMTTGRRPDLNGVQRAQSRIVPEVRAKIRGQRLRIAPQQNPNTTSPSSAETFAVVKIFWIDRAGLHAEDIDDRKHDHQQNGDQILRVHAHIHVAQNHGPKMNRRNFPEMQNPMGRRNRGKEDAQKLAESHAHSGDRPGLNHQKQSPAVEKSPQRPQRLAQINILPAGARHHRGQFAIAERADDGHESGDKPGPDQQGRRIHLARNLGRHNKDAGADHRAHDQHGGAGQAQTFDQFLILMAVDLPVAASGGCVSVCSGILRCRRR